MSEKRLHVTLIADEGVEIREDLLPFLSIVISHSMPGVEARVGELATQSLEEWETMREALSLSMQEQYEDESDDEHAHRLSLLGNILRRMDEGAP